MLAVTSDMVEKIWVRKNKQIHRIVGVCYSPPRQDDCSSELFFKELRDQPYLSFWMISACQTVNWEYHTAGENGSRRLLLHLDDNFLVQIQYLY